jgi:hypothetical protein
MTARRIDRLHPGLTQLARAGSLLVPKQLSWRRAAALAKAGLASIYPFHERWLGRADITEAGRDRAQTEGEGKSHEVRSQNVDGD